VTTRLAIVLVAALIATTGTAFGGDAAVLDLAKELDGLGRGRPAASRPLVKMPEYTVNAVAVNVEIPTHRHEDGSHVLYIVSGRGMLVLDGKTIGLKPGLVVHIPKGIDHSIKAEGGRMTFVDFIQHAFDPAQAEKK
jgi:mannose-6-phosphate isomerase-like protein (cupin superfamily)